MMEFLAAIIIIYIVVKFVIPILEVVFVGVYVLVSNLVARVFFK